MSLKLSHFLKAALLPWVLPYESHDLTVGFCRGERIKAVMVIVLSLHTVGEELPLTHTFIDSGKNGTGWQCLLQLQLLGGGWLEGKVCVGSTLAHGTS